MEPTPSPPSPGLLPPTGLATASSTAEVPGSSSKGKASGKTSKGEFAGGKASGKEAKGKVVSKGFPKGGGAER